MSPQHPGSEGRRSWRPRHKLTAIVVDVLLVVLGFVGVSSASQDAAPDAPLATGFVDIPAREIVVNAPLTPVPSQDEAAVAFGKTDGQVAIVMIEDTRAKSRHSSDGGVTFGSEVLIGGAGTAVVQGGDAALGSDGRIYLAYLRVDPAGDIGLGFARSDDMGQSWTTPKILVQSGDASMGVQHVRITTGGPGRAAIIYRGSERSDPWVIATADSGATWTTPQRIDAGVAPRSSPTGGEKIAMDTAGRIYAVFLQNRGSASVFYTRSTNGGATFATEQAFTLPAHGRSGKPDIAVAFDGGVLVTFWDSAGPDRIYVERSTDQGQTYSTVLNTTLANDEVKLVPSLAVDPATAVTFVTWVRSSSELVVDRSADSGASWGSDQVLAASAAGALIQDTSVSLSRTSTGTWVIGWTDQRSDTYARFLTDVYARSSTNDGVTWDPEQRVDGGTAGSQQSGLQNVAANGSNNVFVLYQDGRDDNGRSYNFYGNRSVASPLAFSADYRVDTDDGTVPPAVSDEMAVATDGASHVYEAFPAFTTGPHSDILVAVSADGGYTFGTPFRVGSTPAGSRIALLPEIRAFSDGRVYLVYMSDNPGVGREIRFNRSTNFGATWQASDTVLATLGHSAGYFEFYDWPGTDLEALSDGTVYVAWSDSVNVFLARSADSGANFSTADVDQDSRGKNRFPRICANGSLVVLSWLSPNLANTNLSIWATSSSNKGATWATSQQLRTEGVPSGVDLQAIACDASGHAVVVWPDVRDSASYRLFSSRFGGSTWSADVAVSSPSGFNGFFPDVTFVNASNAVVVYGDQFTSVYASRSTDDGATFSSFQQLDAWAPDPAAFSFLGQVAADGTGNVWASWLDASAGLPSLAVRRSGDAGATFGSVYRVDRKAPQGGYLSSDYQIPFLPPYGSIMATLPGAAFFGWAAERESLAFDALLNAYDVNDFDRDGTSAATDCSDANPDVQHPPVEAAAVRLSKVTGAVRLSWTSQDASVGVATSYDVTTGVLADLRSSGGYAAATCLADNVTDTPYDDTRSGPTPGNAFYYLVRAQNPCGTGTYGNSSLTPDPRDALDAGGPCP